MKFSGKIEDGTSNKPLNFGSNPWPVCLSVSILLETYKWISMKFSGKIEDGTSKKPLNFGNDLWPLAEVCVCLSVRVTQKVMNRFR